MMTELITHHVGILRAGWWDDVMYPEGVLQVWSGAVEMRRSIQIIDRLVRNAQRCRAELNKEIAEVEGDPDGVEWLNRLLETRTELDAELATTRALLRNRAVDFNPRFAGYPLNKRVIAALWRLATFADDPFWKEMMDKDVDPPLAPYYGTAVH